LFLIVFSGTHDPPVAVLGSLIFSVFWTVVFGRENNSRKMIARKQIKKIFSENDINVKIKTVIRVI